MPEESFIENERKGVETCFQRDAAPWDRLYREDEPDVDMPAAEDASIEHAEPKNSTIPASEFTEKIPVVFLAMMHFVPKR